MKKIFVLVAASFFAVSVFAQFEQGKQRIGGSTNLEFSNIKSKGADYSTNKFFVGIGYGYFAANNLSTDVELEFASIKDSDEDNGEASFDFGFGARYYFPSKVFAGASFSLLSIKYGDEWRAGSGIKLKLGYAGTLNDHIVLEPSICYRLGLSNEEKYTQFNGLTIQIGFSFLF